MEPFVIGESQMVTQRERRSIRGCVGEFVGKKWRSREKGASANRSRSLRLIEPASVLYVNRRRVAKIYSYYSKVRVKHVKGSQRQMII